MPKLDQGDTDNYNIQQGEVQNASTGILNQLNSLLSFSGVQDTYEPGEAISVDIKADTEETYNTEDAIKTVTLYKCADSSCETAPPIDDPSGDQCGSEEWYPDYDDCIAKNTDTVWFSGTQSPGTSWEWDVEFSGLEDEAQYILVGYVQTEDQGIVTDVSEHKFTVEESNDDDGVVNPEPDPEPQMVTYKTPSYTVNDDGSVTGTVGIRNKGDGDMTSSDIVEMQVRPAGSNPLSFTSDTTDVCDSDRPENVHKDYRIDANDEQNIRLETGSVLEVGNSYTVYFMTREGCNPNGDKTPPIYNSYNAGTFTYESSDGGGSDDDTSESEDVVEYGKPELKYENGQVTSTVYFKNNGGGMADRDIVEMQVRPQGSDPLNFVSSTEQVCDSDHPENVHKEYQLGQGEQAKISLSTSEVGEGEKYTVYLLTREGCSPDGDKAQPYTNSVVAGTVDTGEDEVDTGENLPLGIIGAGLLLTGLIGYVVVVRG